jgi:hypothetical protein
MDFTQAVEFGTYGSLLLLLAWLAMFVCYGFRMVWVVHAVFALSFGARVFAVWINETFGLFAPKLAGELALYLFADANRTGIASVVGNKFFLQMLANYPGFSALSPGMHILLTTNAFVAALTAVVAHWYFWVIEKNAKAANFVLIVMSILPAAVSFSIFGLRDPFIYLFMTVFVVTTLIAARRTGVARGLAVVAALLAFWALGSLRVQMLPIAAIFPAILVLLGLRAVRFSTPEERVAALSLVGMVVGIVFIAALFVLIQKGLAATGLSDEGALDEVVIEYAQDRYDRQFKDSAFGGGSAILSQEMFNRLPLPARLLVQIFGMLVLPAPWLITGVERLLAFTDTLFVLGLLYVIWKDRGVVSRHDQMYVSALAVAFFIALVVFGLVITNAGNAFRTRLSVLPFVAIAAAFVLSQKNLLRRSVRRRRLAA